MNRKHFQSFISTYLPQELNRQNIQLKQVKISFVDKNDQHNLFAEPQKQLRFKFAKNKKLDICSEPKIHYRSASQSKFNAYLQTRTSLRDSFRQKQPDLKYQSSIIWNHTNQSIDQISPSSRSIIKQIGKNCNSSSIQYIQTRSLKKQSQQNKSHQQSQLDLKLKSIQLLNQSLAQDISKMRNRINGQIKKINCLQEKSSRIFTNKVQKSQMQNINDNNNPQFYKKNLSLRLITAKSPQKSIIRNKSSVLENNKSKWLNNSSKRSLLDTDYKSFKQSVYQNNLSKQKLHFGYFKQVCDEKGRKYFVPVGQLQGCSQNKSKV